MMQVKMEQGLLVITKIRPLSFMLPLVVLVEKYFCLYISITYDHIGQSFFHDFLVYWYPDKEANNLKSGYTCLGTYLFSAPYDY